jgi:hypothetical protein
MDHITIILEHAIIIKNNEIIKLALNNLDDTISDLNKGAIIHKAIMFDNLDVIKFINEKYCIKDQYRLIEASKKGCVDIVKYFIEHTNLSICTITCNKAFLDACNYGHVNTIKILLKNCNIDPFYNDGISLYYLCTYGYLSILKILSKLINEKNIYHFSKCINFIGKKNNLKITKLLLRKLKEHNCEIDIDKIIKHNIKYNNVKTIKYLLKFRTNDCPILSEKDNIIVIKLAKDCFNHLELIELLICENLLDLMSKYLLIIWCLPIEYNDPDNPCHFIKKILSDENFDISINKNELLKCVLRHNLIEYVELFTKHPKFELYYNEIHDLLRIIKYYNYRNPIKIKIIKIIFDRLNEIICIERIKKWLLKYVVLKPNSCYIQRIVRTFKFY